MFFEIDEESFPRDFSHPSLESKREEANARPTLDAPCLTQSIPRFNACLDPQTTAMARLILILTLTLTPRLLRWLAAQPEEDIVCVSHCNVMLSILGLKGHIANCHPMLRWLTHHGGQLRLQEEAPEEAALAGGRAGGAPPLGSRPVKEGQRRRWAKDLRAAEAPPEYRE